MTARGHDPDTVEPTTTPRTPRQATVWAWLGDWAATVRLGPLSHQAVSRRTGARC
jgi:hypothetical protein